MGSLHPTYTHTKLGLYFCFLICAMVACTQEEVNKALESAKLAQKVWAKVPLWKRAEALHRVVTLLKNHKNSIAECLVKEIAKPSKDAVTEVAS